VGEGAVGKYHGGLVVTKKKRDEIGGRGERKQKERERNGIRGGTRKGKDKTTSAPTVGSVLTSAKKKSTERLLNVLGRLRDVMIKES